MNQHSFPNPTNLNIEQIKQLAKQVSQLTIHDLSPNANKIMTRRNYVHNFQGKTIPLTLYFNGRQLSGFKILDQSIKKENKTFYYMLADQLMHKEQLSNNQLNQSFSNVQLPAYLPTLVVSNNKTNEHNQLKQNTLIKTYLQNFQPRKQKVQIYKENKYRVEIGARCQGNPGEASISYIVKNDNKQIWRNSSLIGHKTINQAQFIALMWSLYDCIQNNIQIIAVYSNKTVIIDSMNNGKIKAPNLLELFDTCRLLSAQFKQFSISYIRRTKYDAIAKQCGVLFERI